MHDERRHDLYRAEKINMVAFIYLDLDLDRVLGEVIRGSRGQTTAPPRYGHSDRQVLMP